MNILFADQFSVPGGGQLCLMDLIPAILRRGWVPHIAVPGAGRLVEWSRQWDIPVHSLPQRPLTRGRKTLRDCLGYGLDIVQMPSMVREIVRQNQIDLVYVNGPRVLPAAIELQCPVIFHAHNVVTGACTRRLTSFLARSTCARVIAVSEFAARPYLSIPGDRVRIIRNGVADFGTNRVFADGPRRVGIVGRIAPEKGQLDFVRAARIIGPNRFSFRIFGEESPNSSYAALVRSEATGTAVQFAGWYDNAEAMFSELDILAVPSSSDEASSRVVIEAFSAGVPVIAYRSGGIPELIEHERTGIFTDSRNWESLACSILQLGSNLQRMNMISTAGRREWEARFTLARYQSELCGLIEETFERRIQSARSVLRTRPAMNPTSRKDGAPDRSSNQEKVGERRRSTHAR